jgi:uncharacterized protein YjeT (DUF2065 family)
MRLISVLLGAALSADGLFALVYPRGWAEITDMVTEQCCGESAKGTVSVITSQSDTTIRLVGLAGLALGWKLMK